MDNTNTNEKNALAELAEKMKEGLACLEMDTVPHWVEVYGKAQRIVAELAKIGKRRDAEFCSDYITDCVSAYELCREIAEEGANNG